MKKLLLLLFIGISFQGKAQSYDTLQVVNWGDGSHSGYSINGTLMEYGNGCTGPAIMVVILDSCSLMPWNNENVDHGNWNLFFDFPNPLYYVCRNRAENYFIYSMNNPSSFSKLYSWMRDTVPDGNYVLIYSWLTWSWTSNNNFALDSLMNYLGCNTWPAADSVPFTFFVQKGHINHVDTLVQGSTPTDSANLYLVFSTGCTVGIDETMKGNILALSPNPAHDNFTLSESGELNVYDITGRAVLNKVLTEPESKIDCSNFPKGVYFVRVNRRNKIFNQKLVIE